MAVDWDFSTGTAGKIYARPHLLAPENCCGDCGTVTGFNEACHHFPIHLKHVIIEKRESFQGDAVLHIQVNGYGICIKIKADIVFSFIG